MDFYKQIEALPKLRQKQILHALYKEYIFDFDKITTISKYERENFKNLITLKALELVDEQLSDDQSIKWLFKTHDGHFIETVLMRFKDGRNTVCVSSQIGCPVGCQFCATGKNGFIRNLDAYEIVFQVLNAAAFLKTKELRVSNVVFMGMGEPLLNLQNVIKAIYELNNEDGFGLGARHICVSTSGPLEQLKKFIEADTKTALAISLHAPNQRLREELMPLAKANPLSKLMEVLDAYVKKTNRKVSYEYILLAGVNDSEKDAQLLAELLKGRLAFVNLIRYNQVQEIDFNKSPKESVDKFKEILEKNRIPVSVRVSLGKNINAACGQLAGKRKKL